MQGVFVPDNQWVGDFPEDMLAEKFDPALWAQFEKCELSLSKKSWVDYNKLRAVARERNFPRMELVEEVAEMLEHGARTGVRGAARLPSHGPNSRTLQGLGPQVLDTLRTWCKEEVLCGPLEDHEIPANAKSSPLAAVLKPTGRARSVSQQLRPR